MSCECESYSCVEAFINPCSAGVQLDITATYSGNMTVRVWFGGRMRSYGISVVQDAKIIVPTIAFNENYTHGVRLYNGDTLIACYWVNTITDTDSGDYPVPPINESEMQGKSYVGGGTNSQVFAEIEGKTLLSIAMGGADYGPDFWTQTGTSVTWSGIGADLIFNGTIVLNWIN